MPYRKSKRRSKRKSNRTVGWYDQKFSARQVAQQALMTANAVKKLLNVEFKHHDASASATPSSSGAVYLLSTIPQGDGPSTRDGSSVRIKSLTIHGYASYNTSSTDPPKRSILRVMVVQARTDQSPTTATLLDNADVLSMRNLDYTGNQYFSVLADRTIHMEVYNPQKPLSFQINDFPEEHIEWDNSDTAGTNYKKGGIYIFAISDQSTYTPTYEYQSRVRYIDN